MKKKILIVSDPLSTVTGLAYVAGSFARYFCSKPDEYEVGYFTLRGEFTSKILAVDNMEGDPTLDNLKIMSIKDNTPQNLLANFTKIIGEFQPQIVITVADPWELEAIAFCELRYSYCWIAYTTIEVPRIYGDRVFNQSYVIKRNFKSIYEVLSKANLIVPVTEMAKNALIELDVMGHKLDNVCVNWVYNGLDVEKKIVNKHKRSEIFKGMIKDDEFVFMSLGVNSERKKLEQTIIAFHHFLQRLVNKKEDISKIKLYLHTNLHSAPNGTDLMSVINEYKLNDFVIGMSTQSLLPKEKIYEIYSACDVYVSFSGGEGFGYGCAEAMLNGLPLVYINHGGHCEFACYGGLPVGIRDYCYAIKLGMKWALPDFKDASKQMYALYRDKKKRDELGKAGQEHIVENFGWDKIGSQLEEIILKHYANTKDQNLYGMKIKRLG